ncbi:hypothetical protein [Actinomycetospora sp. CA-053990]|uniref:hypothetical protein n=1 Tax=Actinomycetospora sp. CA-053990 TaxID=3239891 RepID=UPI003D8E1698
MTGALLVSSAVVVTLAFAGLGSAFDDPDVLGEPAGQVLADFGAQPWLVGSLFALLALGAAMLAPIALGTARPAWTVLILVDLRRRFALPRLFAVVGLVSAVLILAGLLVPLGVPGADATNFAGFLLWSAWIVWFGVLVWRGAFRAPAAPAPGPTARPLPA